MYTATITVIDLITKYACRRHAILACSNVSYPLNCALGVLITSVIFFVQRYRQVPLDGLLTMKCSIKYFTERILHRNSDRPIQ